jgi:hypothetical protein
VFGEPIRSSEGVAELRGELLQECLQRWLGLTNRPTNSCQTDDAGQRLNRQALESAGYQVVEAHVSYEAELTIDELVGGVLTGSHRPSRRAASR